MRRIYDLFVCVLLAFAALLPTAWLISVRRRPNDVYVNEGGTIEISCDVDHRDTQSQIIGFLHIGSGNMLSYGRQILPSLDADRRSRYSIIGSVLEDIYTLHIEGARMIDAGIFKCGYYRMGGDFTPLVQATVTVRRLTSSVTLPQCRFSVVEQRDPGLNIGDMVDFICSWNNDSFVTGASWSSNGKLLNTRTENQVVWTRRTLVAADNGQNFTCTLRTSTATEMSRTCSVAPFRISPTANISPEQATANIGDAVEFACQGSGLPEISSYRWMSPASVTERLMQGYHDGNGDQQPSRVQMLTNKVLRISDIRQEDDGTTVSCEVQIPSGMSAMATATLRVRHDITPRATKSPLMTVKITPTPKTTTLSSNIRHVGNNEGRNSPIAPDSDSINNNMDTTDIPADVTNKKPVASHTTPFSKHGYTTGILDNASIQYSNKTIIITLGVAGLVLLILLILTVIISTIKICSKDNRQLKLENGQLPLHVVNDSYGQVQLLSPNLATLPEEKEEKTYEEVTTVITMPLTPSPSKQNKSPEKVKNPCPIYATPNKQKRNSSPALRRVHSHYANMPSERLSQYDTPSSTLTRPTTPPPPPPPPKYEDVVLPPPRRHRPLGPAKSCSTFSRSTYSSLASEDEFCESAEVVDAIRSNYMAAFKEEEGPMEPVDYNHKRVLIEDEYVQLDTRHPKLLNIEGLQYADLDLNENNSDVIIPEECPTQYAHISATLATPL